MLMEVVEFGSMKEIRMNVPYLHLYEPTIHHRLMVMNNPSCHHKGWEISIS